MLVGHPLAKRPLQLQPEWQTASQPTKTTYNNILALDEANGPEDDVMEQCNEPLHDQNN